MDEVKLNKCPFCKEYPNKLEFCLSERVYSETEWEDVFAVCCTNGECEAHGAFKSTEDEAVAAWNDV